MRSNNPPIIGRIEDDLFVMDLRTIQEGELSVIEAAFENLIQKA
jgi:L-seryl-tRNA(Ser) seleniumtransferase